MVSFSSYFLSLTRPIVCLVYRLSIMKGLTELSTYFYNSAVKTLPQVFWLVQRKETNVTVSTTILGKFLSVFFYLARLASVWCVNTDKRNWKLFISCYLQLDATSCAVRNGTQETWIPMDVDFWIMCCWLARLQERGPTGLCGKSQVEHFILPHTSSLIQYLNSIPFSGREICCKCSRSRDLEGPFWISSLNLPTQSWRATKFWVALGNVQIYVATQIQNLVNYCFQRVLCFAI